MADGGRIFHCGQGMTNSVMTMIRQWSIMTVIFKIPNNLDNVREFNLKKYRVCFGKPIRPILYDQSSKFHLK